MHMTKQCYHVIAYRILTYLYDCLKRGHKIDKDIISAETLVIEYSYWVYILKHLRQGGYVDGGYQGETLSGAPTIRLDLLEITPDGIEYMEQNSTMAKARDFLKTLKEIVPGM